MIRLLLLCLLLFALVGCRFSISAEKLQLSAAVDQTAYLSKEDSTTYESSTSSDPDPVNE